MTEELNKKLEETQRQLNVIASCASRLKILSARSIVGQEDYLLLQLDDIVGMSKAAQEMLEEIETIRKNNG